MAENRTILKENRSGDISEMEEKRIREAIARTDTEKFFLFTRLMKIHVEKCHDYKKKVF